MQSEEVILPSLVLKEDIYTVMRELDLLLDSVYKKDTEGFDEVVKRLINLDLYNAVIKSFEINGGANSIQAKKTIIELLKKHLEEIPVLKLELAVSPTREVTERIHDWAKMNLDENVVLEISDDNRLLAGAKLSYGGKYTDKTLLKRWPSLWEKVKKE